MFDDSNKDDVRDLSVMCDGAGGRDMAAVGRVRRVWLTVLLVVNILVVPVTLISGYGGLVNPEVSVLPAMMAMTFPLWAVIEVVLLVVTLCVSRRMALIPGVTLLLSLGAIWDICPLNVPHGELSADERRRSFTLMSYNVFEFRDQEGVMPEWGNRTASQIINSGADVVCVLESYAIAANPRSGVTWAQTDSAQLVYPYSIRDGAGVSIYSKYPIRRVEMPQAVERYSYWLGGVVEIEGHEVFVVAVHLESFGLTQEDRAAYSDLTSGSGGRDQMDAYMTIASKLKRAFKARARQSRQLRELINGHGYENVIVAGDFNDISGCYAIHQIAGGDMRDAYRTAGFGPMTTYNSQRFYFHIDQILYRGDFEAVNYRRGSVPSSDHYPVFTTFIFNE